MFASLFNRLAKTPVRSTMILGVIVILLSLGIYQIVNAAWIAEDNFDSYSNGNTVPTLNGGSGWTVAWINDYQCTNSTIQTSVVYQGANAVISASGTDAVCTRYVTDITSGTVIVYFAVRRTVNNSGQAVIYFAKNDPPTNTSLLRINFNPSGNIVLDGATDATIFTGYSTNTWYVIRVTLNATARTATAAYSTGAYGTAGTFSAESASVAYLSGNDIGQFKIAQEAGTSAVTYWDYISPTSPFTSAVAAKVPDIIIVN